MSGQQWKGRTALVEGALPYPVANGVWDVLNAAGDDLSAIGVAAAVEELLRFLCAVLLADAYADNRRSGDVDKALAQLARPSTGHWVSFLQLLVKSASSNPTVVSAPLVQWHASALEVRTSGTPDPQGSPTQEVAHWLRELPTLRNHAVHAGRPSERSRRDETSEMRRIYVALVDSLSWLADWALVVPGRVRSRRDRYEGELLWFRGHSGRAKSESAGWRGNLTSDEFWWLSPDRGHALCLHPFVRFDEPNRALLLFQAITARGEVQFDRTAELDGTLDLVGLDTASESAALVAVDPVSGWLVQPPVAQRSPSYVGGADRPARRSGVPASSGGVAGGRVRARKGPAARVAVGAAGLVGIAALVFALWNLSESSGPAASPAASESTGGSSPTLGDSAAAEPVAVEPARPGAVAGAPVPAQGFKLPTVAPRMEPASELEPALQGNWGITTRVMGAVHSSEPDQWIGVLGFYETQFSEYAAGFHKTGDYNPNTDEPKVSNYVLNSRQVAMQVRRTTQGASMIEMDIPLESRGGKVFPMHVMLLRAGDSRLAGVWNHTGGNWNTFGLWGVLEGYPAVTGRRLDVDVDGQPCEVQCVLQFPPTTRDEFVGILLGNGINSRRDACIRACSG